MVIVRLLYGGVYSALKLKVKEIPVRCRQIAALCAEAET